MEAKIIEKFRVSGSVKNFKAKSNVPHEEYLVNQKITFPEVRVLDAKNEMLGVMKTQDAISLAESKDLDLIIMTEKANPPIAKMMEYGKFIYEKEKQKKESKKKQKVTQLKEIKLRTKIGAHDLEVKTKNIVKFLENKDKVKVSVAFFGREKEHTDLGAKLLNKIIESTKDYADIEKPIEMLGNNMLIILGPKKDK